MSDQGIQPQPQPTMWGVDHTADGKFVVIIKQTHGGTSVDFITPENATDFWQAIRAQAKVCYRMNNGGGLEVPAKVILGADGTTLRVVEGDDAEAAAQARADAAAEDAAVREVMGDGE